MSAFAAVGFVEDKVGAVGLAVRVALVAIKPALALDADRVPVLGVQAGFALVTASEVRRAVRALALAE